MIHIWPERASAIIVVFDAGWCCAENILSISIIQRDRGWCAASHIEAVSNHLQRALIVNLWLMRGSIEFQMKHLGLIETSSCQKLFWIIHITMKQAAEWLFVKYTWEAEKICWKRKRNQKPAWPCLSFEKLPRAFIYIGDSQKLPKLPIMDLSGCIFKTTNISFKSKNMNSEMSTLTMLKFPRCISVPPICTWLPPPAPTLWLPPDNTETTIIQYNNNTRQQ